MRFDLLAACVLLAGLPAQQRRPLVGRVLDAAGTAVRGAQVTLVWSPPGGPECGTTDVVTVATDERGRFVAKLLPQESYSAWALATGPDGTARASAVGEGAAAGGDLELRLELPAPRRRVELVGAEQWATAGPLRVAVAPRAANITGWPLDEHGQTPPLPPLGLALVRDAEDRVLFLQSLPRGGANDPVVIRLPLQHALQLKVTDPAGAPLAGATVHHATAPAGIPLVLDT